MTPVASAASIAPPADHQASAAPASVGVPRRTRLAYAAGAIAYGIKDNGFSVFLLLFYNQIVGLDAGLVGLMLLLALVLDAFIDPIVGHLSDRTRTRWGRRHPWLYASALPIAGFWLALWMPPQGSDTFQLLWLLGCATLVRMSLSLNEVPSIAMAPEMTEDYHERTAILGLRYLFGWMGGLAILAAAYGYFELADPDVASEARFHAYAIAGSAIMFVSILVSAIGTHKLFAKPKAEHVHQPTLADMAVALRYKPFLILMLAVFFGFASQGVTFALSSFLLGYVWKLGSAEQVIYAACLFFGVIGALVIARRMGFAYGKRRTAMLLALATGLIGALPYVLLLAGLFPTPGTTPALVTYLIFVTISTATGVATMISAASIMADVTTAHRAISGKSQEGVFFAGQFFMQKCVTGIGIFAAGQILVLVDFPAMANPATIDAAVVSSLAATYVVVVLALQIATAWAFSRFPADVDSERAAAQSALANAGER